MAFPATLQLAPLFQWSLSFADLLLAPEAAPDLPPPDPVGGPAGAGWDSSGAARRSLRPMTAARSDARAADLLAVTRPGEADAARIVAYDRKGRAIRSEDLARDSRPRTQA